MDEIVACSMFALAADNNPIFPVSAENVAILAVPILILSVKIVSMDAVEMPVDVTFK